jgi:two-component system response regulator RegX3
VADVVSVLLVEDEESFVEALTIGLRREGFEVTVARHGVEALESFDAHPPDIVLLDLWLPKKSGIDVCREIRAKSSVPIIIVSARSSETDMVVGLEVGADDYVTKPFGMRELLARIRAVLRRSRAPGHPVAVTNALESDGLVLDPQRHELRKNGQVVSLTLKEWDLLELLMANSGRVLTRETLVARVWGPGYTVETKSLDVHIKRLRSKVEDDPSRPTRIVTIRGLGYKFAGST